MIYHPLHRSAPSRAGFRQICGTAGFVVLALACLGAPTWPRAVAEFAIGVLLPCKNWARTDADQGAGASFGLVMTITLWTLLSLLGYGLTHTTALWLPASILVFVNAVPLVVQRKA